MRGKITIALWNKARNTKFPKYYDPGATHGHISSKKKKKKRVFAYAVEEFSICEDNNIVDWNYSSLVFILL